MNGERSRAAHSTRGLVSALPAAIAALGFVLVVGSARAGESGAGAASGDDEPPGSITFVGRNLVATANGTFQRWKITRADIDRESPENSVVEIEIEVASLETGIDRRDRHLRTDDFFDVEKYPTATIRAHSPIALRGNDRDGFPLYRVTLEIEIHGRQKAIEAQVTIVDDEPLSVRGELVLDRRNFDIGDDYRRVNPLSIRNEVPVRFTATLP